MIINIKQNTKELFEAVFTIESESVILGDMKLVGKLGHMEGTWSINYAGSVIKMMYGKKNLPKGDKPFRPYDIYVNDSAMGTVYQTDVKEGGLLSKYSVHKVYFNREYYTLYPICFGDEGAKSPLFYQGKQVAEIHKPSEVYNELHEYCAYVTERQHDLISVLLCCYSYVMGFFKPGEKPTMSVRKISFTDTNKYLLAKYNPDFMLNFKK